jgi:hypothetical protein
MSGPAVTTLGANRTVVHFYSWGETIVAASPPGSGFTTAYNQTTTLGVDAGVVCTYQEVASASSIGAETVSLAGSKRWRSYGLAMIKA